MKRDPRLWLLLAVAAAGPLIVLALLLLPRLGGGRPGPDPREWEGQLVLDGRPDAPLWMKVSALAGGLQEAAPGLRVERPGPSSNFCYVLADGAERPPFPPWEEYADCWRGALLCMTLPPPGMEHGPHACRAGDFTLFGDVELIETVRPVAEGVHLDPGQGVGGPAAP